MWFLQRKSTHKRLLMWLKLASFVSFLHVIFLILLLFIYKDGISNLTFLITSGNIRRDIAFTIAIETIPQKKEAPVKAKKSTTPAQTAVISSVEKKEEGMQPAIKKAAPIQSPPVQKKQALPPVVKKEPEHLDMHITSHKEMRGFEQECATLYQEIAECWMPPPGVPNDSACKITVSIDRQGMVSDMNVDTSSGMLVFDLAARSAVSDLNFPRFAWGKSITITFTV